MSKRAQERVLLAQVGREIQVNLRHMEQVLDAFFRDNTKRADLATLAQGQRADPRRAAHPRTWTRPIACSSCASSRSRSTPIPTRRSATRTSSCSPNRCRASASTSKRSSSSARTATDSSRRSSRSAWAKRPRRPQPERDSVEAAVAELRAALAAARRGSAHARRATPPRATSSRRSSSSLRDDAELIGDADLVAQADGDPGGTRGRQRGASSPPPSMRSRTRPRRRRKSPRRRSDCSPPMPRSSTASSSRSTSSRPRKCWTASSAITRRSTDNPGDREALQARSAAASIRSRAAAAWSGLTELGEYAYEAEGVFNRLLEEERPVTGAVLAMIDVAHRSFRGWVDALTQRKARHRRPAPAARRDRRGRARAAGSCAGGRSRRPSNVIELPRAIVPASPPNCDRVTGP